MSFHSAAEPIGGNIAVGRQRRDVRTARAMSQGSPQTEVQTPGDPAADFDFRAVLAELSTLLSKQLFFIGGSIGAGTTWLQVLLDQHPQISCRGEGHFVTYLVGALKHTVEEYNRYLVTKN